MIDPYSNELLDRPRDDERLSAESLRCAECGSLVASLPQLLDHYDRRH